MTESTEIYCKTCKWWEPLPDIHVADDEFRGECRRFPPLLCESLDIADAKFLGDKCVIPHGRFPVTNDDEWCGEWQESEQRQ